MTECLAPACVVQPTVQFLVGGGVVVMVPTPYQVVHTGQGTGTHRICADMEKSAAA